MRLYFFLKIMVHLIDLIIVLNIIFKERRNVQSTLAWIILFIFMPIVGLIIYIPRKKYT